ncbi:MAG: hypothetical protein ACI85F_002462 [Bacteroidia bacterium]|jgi:hypothetical protein
MELFAFAGMIMTVVFYLVFHVNFFHFTINRISFSRRREAIAEDRHDGFFSFWSFADVFRVFEPIETGLKLSDQTLQEYVDTDEKLWRRTKRFGTLTFIFFTVTLIIILNLE